MARRRRSFTCYALTTTANLAAGTIHVRLNFIYNNYIWFLLLSEKLSCLLKIIGCR